MEQRSRTQTAVPSTVGCGQASRTWRRQLGALAWATLEELALTACHDEEGWASLVGVRDTATNVGTTDASAVRALAALARAGLVALGQVTDALGHRRLGYRLHLPEGITVVDGPGNEAVGQGVAARCPNDRDAGVSGQ